MIYFLFVLLNSLGWGSTNQHLRVPHDFAQKCIFSLAFVPGWGSKNQHLRVPRDFGEQIENRADTSLLGGRGLDAPRGIGTKKKCSILCKFSISNPSKTVLEKQPQLLASKFSSKSKTSSIKIIEQTYKINKSN